jgi:hypothetical protein
MRSLSIALALGLLLAGCPATQQTPPARAQEAATELNLNARFGRMELAAEHVSQDARAAFFDRRKGWGGKVRIADYELAGLRILDKKELDAEVFVKVAWYRIDEGDLHVTTIKQKWHDFKGSWRLVDEQRLDGDVGLLGEYVPPPPAPTAPRNAQFPTIHIGNAAPTSGSPGARQAATENEPPSP